MTTREKEFYMQIIWFDNRRTFDLQFFDFLQPQREVSDDPRYKSGLFYSEKCRRNIQYESGVELEFIKQLEELDIVKFYYEQPVKIKYTQGKIKRGYTPDFGIFLTSNEFIIAEVKSMSVMLEDKVQLKAEALLDFCSKKGFGFMLTDGKHTFNDLLKKLRKVKVNRTLEKEILSVLDKRPLRRHEYAQIVEQCDSTQSELLKIILKHDLRYKEYPFKLRHGKLNPVFRQVFVEKKKYEDIQEEKFSNLFKSSTSPAPSHQTDSGS